MEKVYDFCPDIENERYLLRFVRKDDAEELLKIYSDKNALPFFNCDNCHGDNFYYPTMDKMSSAIDFWLSSFERKWFVRWVITDKKDSRIIGSVELFNRKADDDFNDVGVLRLDLGSEYENAAVIKDILSLIVPPSYELFECEEIISKVPLYAIERQKAFSAYGFEKSDSLLIGTIDHYAYKDYWKIRK